jgi:hypothetical protein
MPSMVVSWLHFPGSDAGSPPPTKTAAAAAVLNGGADGSGDEEEDPEDVEDTTQYYDKQKSFFDSISCDATDRAKGYVPFCLHKLRFYIFSKFQHNFENLFGRKIIYLIVLTAFDIA